MNFLTKITILILSILALSFSGNIVSLHEERTVQPEAITEAEHDQMTRILERDLINSIDSMVKKYTDKFNFNGQALVRYNGTVIYKHSSGMAHFGKKRKLDSSSSFQLASISKQFTAMAIMILEERGQLNYDDTVTQHIPELPYEGVTIRHLLNHTAGLPNYMWLVENHWPKDVSPTNEDVIELFEKHELRHYFRSGYRFNYSNTGYMLLASVVERITEQKFGDWMEANVFKPLNMNNSFVYSAARDRDYPVRVHGYRKYRWGLKNIPENDHDGVVGDKGVYASIEDLALWDEALMENELISPETKQKAFKRVTLKNGYKMDYGFGFRIQEQHGKKVVYHNGLWNGFRTSIKRHIEDSNTVIVFNNTDSRLKSGLVKRLEHLLHMNQKLALTHRLVRKTLRKSTHQALEYYSKYQEKHQVEGKINRKAIEEVINMFKLHGKTQFAEKLKNLNRQLHQTVENEVHQEVEPTTS